MCSLPLGDQIKRTAAGALAVIEHQYQTVIQNIKVWMLPQSSSTKPVDTLRPTVHLPLELLTIPLNLSETCTTIFTTTSPLLLRRGAPGEIDFKHAPIPKAALCEPISTHIVKPLHAANQTKAP